MIRWVFLDVGNVLLDEDPLGYVNVRIHWEAIQRVRPEITFRNLLAERERRVARGSRWPLFQTVADILDEAARDEAWARAEREVRARFDELSPVIEGALTTVEQLAGRFRLGLIANQGRECRDRLDTLGLLHFFDVVALSEEEGCFKPDAALFRIALDRAGVAPEQSLMVGDRLENDIAPASMLGMRTAWIRWPRRSVKGWRPDDPEAIAWRDSLERCSALAPQLHPEVRPWLVVDEIRDLDGALRGILGGDPA